MHILLRNKQLALMCPLLNVKKLRCMQKELEAHSWTQDTQLANSSYCFFLYFSLVNVHYPTCYIESMMLGL
jgi:hypothetical protein